MKTRGRPSAEISLEELAWLAASGVSQKEAAAHYGVTQSTISNHAAKHSIRFSRDRSKAWPNVKRAALMAAMRPSKTYEEIGAIYGITRERVRQILNKHGYSDAVGFKASPRARIPAVCACGAEGIISRKQNGPFVCKRCRHLARTKKYQLAPLIVADRQSGLTWKAIAEKHGLHNPSHAQQYVKDYFAFVGGSVADGVFGFYGARQLRQVA